MNTIDARIAYINSQVACMLARLEAMKAENQTRAARGKSQAYTETDFNDLPNVFGVHHNAVVGFLA